MTETLTTDVRTRAPAPPSAGLPRLLAGAGERDMRRLDQHLAVHGTLPPPDLCNSEWLIDLVARAGLRGHGGAAFPVATKLRATVGRTGRAIVAANGTEGEPASAKDKLLLRELPHLVLDGAAVAARAVEAEQVVLAVAADDPSSAASLEAALRERDRWGLQDPSFALFRAPPRYVTGQATALVNALNGGPAKPTLTPPHVAERGVRRRPTLLQNVETLAHLALIARRGSEWFRQIGTPADPGSALTTLSGAIADPGVYEIAHGMPLATLLQHARPTGEVRAALVGGYFGTWLAAAEIAGARLSREELAPLGAGLGAGVIVALHEDACPVAYTSRIVDFLASESAGQCGPCVHGLAAIADTIQRILRGTADRWAETDVQRWAAQLPGRGACSHPDGAGRLVTSAFRAFGREFAAHARAGHCGSRDCRADAALLSRRAA